MRGSFSWNLEGMVSGKVVLSEMMSLVSQHSTVDWSVYMETGRGGFRKNSLKGGNVLGEGFIYMESGRDSLRKRGGK